MDGGAPCSNRHGKHVFPGCGRSGWSWRLRPAVAAEAEARPRPRIQRQRRAVAGAETPPPVNSLNDDVRAIAVTDLGLSGDPATPRGAARTLPDNDPLVKLGQLLFFSQTLSAEFDVSCGSCHHPDFAGGDGLSLAVWRGGGKQRHAWPGPPGRSGSGP